MDSVNKFIDINDKDMFELIIYMIHKKNNINVDIIIDKTPNVFFVFTLFPKGFIPNNFKINILIIK